MVLRKSGAKKLWPTLLVKQGVRCPTCQGASFFVSTTHDNFFLTKTHPSFAYVEKSETLLSPVRSLHHGEACLHSRLVGFYSFGQIRSIAEGMPYRSDTVESLVAAPANMTRETNSTLPLTETMASVILHYLQSGL